MVGMSHTPKESQKLWTKYLTIKIAEKEKSDGEMKDLKICALIQYNVSV